MAYEYHRKSKTWYEQNKETLKTIKNLKKTLEEIEITIFEITGEINTEEKLNEIYGTKKYKGKKLKIIELYQLYKEMKKYRQIAQIINSDESVKKGKFKWKLYI